MASSHPAEATDIGPTPRLGFYALTPGLTLTDVIAQPRALYRGQSVGRKGTVSTPVLSAQTLYPLTEHCLDDVACVIADIRRNARQVLSDCRPIAEGCPVIVLADPDQAFADDYPFGTYIYDVTTPDELGKAVFWHRVQRAVKAYDVPISVADTCSPVYSVLKAIANQTSDWIFIKDLQHRFVVAGEHFAAAAGVSIDNVVGRDDLDIGSSVEAVKGNPATGEIGFWAQDDAVTRSGKASVEENPEWLLYSSKARYRRTYRVPLKNPAGKVFALLVCSQDITEHKRNEQLLNERTAMLEQVTAEKQRAEVNRQIAEDAVEAKTRFLASASHDLRQPLHAMGLFLDSLDKRLEGSSDHYLVQQIKQSCTSLSILFNSCLDISRLDAGVVERRLEHIGATAFLDDLDEEFRRQTRDKSLDYRRTVDDSAIYSDQVLLARIVRNLVNNAVQNTEQGCVSIECQRAGARVNLSVTDTGSGIASDELERVFNEFHQINKNDARRGRGLGLGLSIVKRLCEILEINITLDSDVGRGTRFTLSIPAGELASVPDEKFAQQVSLPEELVVLIVDDDQYIRYGMEVLLDSFGCQTVCAADAQSAMRMLQEENIAPDVIVADYHLAVDATGTQAIVELRRFLGRAVPALLVTGDTSMQSERDAAVYDVPVLHKPVDSDELLSTINSEVRRFAPGREN